MTAARRRTGAAPGQVVPRRAPGPDGQVADTPPAALVLPAAITEFLAFLAGQKQASSHTLDAYRRDLTALAAWAQPNAVTALDSAALRAFIAAEHRRGLAASSVQRRLSACRALYRWLLRHGQVTADPTAGVRAPRAGRKLPNVLDPDQAKVLVEVPDDGPLGLRDRAMLELFYSSGLRVAELCALRWQQLALEAGLVTVLGKGRRERIVPVGSHARRALQAWRSASGGADDAPVFPGRGGRPITPRAVQARMALLGRRQNVLVHVHPHMLRHSFASHVLESSGDLRGVQELLGHADIATTQIYTHLDYQHLAKVYDQAHPRARRRKAADD